MVYVCLGGAPVSAGSANPLLEEWSTPFGVPPFDSIRTEHYLPAYQEALARKRAEVEAIAAHPEAPTFANTYEALDAAGELLEKVNAVFSHLNAAETNDQMQDLAREVAPLKAALNDDILMNEALFARLEAVWERRDSLGLAPVQLRLMEETRKDFVRGGAKLSPKDKERLRAINAELSVLHPTFSDNVLAETNAFRLVVDDPAALGEMPESVVEAAAATAREAGLEGRWVFTLQAASLWPFLTYSPHRDLRRQILQAYLDRGHHGDEHDNKPILTRIAELRAQKANLLSYPTYADYALADRMAGTPERARDLLDRLWEPAQAAARREAADLQTMIRREGYDFALEPWDWRYYAEKVRQERYHVDDNELRPFFPLEAVIEGAYGVAGRLYGVRFVERTDLPKYHPEVRTYEVLDADGSHLGVFLVDYHPRAGKRFGAWSGEYRNQYYRDGKDVRPIVVNVGNFTRPAGNAPALLTMDEVETLFHELGHGLHSLLSRVRYKTLSDVPGDFVELPSQIMENWALEPEVLKEYARHWQTGRAIPDTLIDKLQKAKKFNQGFANVEYLAASYLDLAWHRLAPGAEVDATAFEAEALAEIGLMPEIPVRYRSPYFQHIFSGGYAAGYYNYVWADVLSADAFQAFKENGLFDPATARAFRTHILEQGGSVEAMEMYRRFRGHEPSVEPLLEKRGLK
ncbi:MAG: M3 family peptidase [Candidatus Zixiibacteriota bacterium]|nr:MAG: M3 family peptidase [candidate division Zixibacteria bacterium]